MKITELNFKRKCPGILNEWGEGEGGRAGASGYGMWLLQPSVLGMGIPVASLNM